MASNMKSNNTLRRGVTTVLVSQMIAWTELGRSEKINHGLTITSG